MARKRKSSRRRYFGGFKKKSRRSGGGGDNLLLTAGAAAVYGAARPKIEQWVAPVTSKLPVMGGYADEIALGTLGYFLAKGKIPMLKGKAARAAGKAMLTIEAARVGSGLGAQFIK